jgi:F-type H+-transporting ATPase subunit a
MTILQGLAVDTLHQAAAAAHGAAEAHGAEEGVDIVHHLADGHVMEFPPFGEIHLPQFHLLGLDLSITKYTVYMWIAAALLLVILLPMARRRGRVHKGLYNAFEALIVYVRDEIVYANLGREEGRPYVPFIATLFFFILFMNLLGLVPYGGTPTGNLAVTGVLALFSMVAIEISGIVANGPVRYAKSLVPEGVPMYLAPIMIPIEIIGHRARILSLGMRLFGNIFGEHAATGIFMGMLPFVLPWPMMGLGLFGAFLQTFVFIMLTMVYIGGAVAAEEH